MAFEVRFLKDFDVVETIYSGTVTAADVDRGVAETGVVAAANLCNRFLVDCRDQEPGGSALDIFALAEYLCSLPVGTIEREAILPPQSAAGAQELEFFETACRNRGLEVRLFADRDEALEWLKA
jgi:hypothetical protein